MRLIELKSYIHLLLKLIYFNIMFFLQILNKHFKLLLL